MKVKEYKELTQPTEHTIQTECINFLRSKGYYVLRLNSGKYSVGEGRFKRFIMGQAAGTPDLLAFSKPYADCDCQMPAEVRLLFIEIKRPKQEPTVTQALKMEELETYGARCVVVHSVEELEKELCLN